MSSHLDRLLELASSDSRAEQEFFLELLGAMVYAHIPAEDCMDNGRVRFVQFDRPENGQRVLPFFTDESKCRAAEGATVRSIALQGRLFFQLTLGATLMMNPNDVSCVLYPEEVDALLNDGSMATLAKFTPAEVSDALIGAPVENPPDWLISALIKTVKKLPYIAHVYVAAFYDSKGGHAQKSFVFALSADDKHGERAVRAVNSAIQPLCREHGGPSVDLTHFGNDEPPGWIERLSLTPVYSRPFTEH